MGRETQGFAALTPAQRSLAASQGSLINWSRRTSPEARRQATEAARAARRRNLERQADPEGVLSPEELEAYDLRASPTANQLRYNLTAFDATEDEYRAIFKVQRAYDEQLRDLAPTLGSGPLTPEQSRARQTIQEQLNADLKAALGDQRYADYQRAMDYNYRQTTQLVARLNLPPQTANELYAVQKEMEQRRMNFAASANGTALTREQAMDQMTALQQEATARVTSALGGNAAALEAYKQYGGSWLANLVPRPPRPLGPATGPARGGGGGGG